MFVARHLWSLRATHEATIRHCHTAPPPAQLSVDILRIVSTLRIELTIARANISCNAMITQSHVLPNLICIGSGKTVNNRICPYVYRMNACIEWLNVLYHYTFSSKTGSVCSRKIGCQLQQDSVFLPCLENEFKCELMYWNAVATIPNPIKNRFGRGILDAVWT
jgi:hypothetical protein